VACACLLLLAACAGEFDTVGEPLRLVQPALPNAVVREPYEAALHAVGGLRPYEFKLRSGSLPQGVSLQNGSLRGTPTDTGTFQFSIAVSDANLNNTVNDYRLIVTQLPPPGLSLTPPLTEVRGAVTLRARVEDARRLSAVRLQVTWDAQLFELVPDSVTAATRDAALLTDAGPGRLQVDLALLGRTLDGDADLFRLTLRPLVEATNLFIEERAEFLSASLDPSGGHHFLRQTEGRRPTAPAAERGQPDQQEPLTPDTEEER
jgi:hypothetical protein